MSKRILVAEDEKPLSKAMTLKLTHEGYAVDAAFDGKEALNFLEKGTYDLVLLDLMMPEVDGFMVLEELQKKGNKTPVLVTTNLSQPEDLERVKSLGARGYLVKSNSSISSIVAHIKKVLA